MVNPALSIIICSIDEGRFAAVRAMFERVLAGVDHEILRIPDAAGLAEGYNRGWRQSRGQWLIFCHDDIAILSDDFAKRFFRHMAQFDLLGVAGTSRLISASWFDAGRPFIHGCVVQPPPSGGQGVELHVFDAQLSAISPVQAVDGLFIAVRRELIETLQGFDETLDGGFHLYDIEFSFRAYLAGAKCAVAGDILIYHESLGLRPNEVERVRVWRAAKTRFEERYRDQLSASLGQNYDFLRFVFPDTTAAVATFRGSLRAFERVRSKEKRSAIVPSTRSLPVMRAGGSAPLRILYVAHSFPPIEFSGSPLIASRYAEYATAAGHSVAVAFAVPESGVRLPSVTASGIQLIPVAQAEGQFWGLSAYSVPPEVTLEVKALVEFHPDIVHIVDWVNLPSAILAAARASGAPVIRHITCFEDICFLIAPTFHHADGRPCQAPITAAQCADCLLRRQAVKVKLTGNIDDEIKQFSIERKNMKLDAEKLIENKWISFRCHLDIFSEIVFPSEEFRKYFESIIDLGATRRTVIGHGIAPQPTRISSRGVGAPLRFFFLGPCLDTKGWDLVEKCFLRVLTAFSGRIKLVVYGSQYLSKPSLLASHDDVEFNQYFDHEQLPVILSDCDVGLVPSRFESFGLVCREFLAMGIPVIGSTAFGMLEVLEHGRNGLVIQEWTVELLESTVRLMMENPELVVRLEEGARATRLTTPNEEYFKIEKLYYSHLEKNKFHTKTMS